MGAYLSQPNVEKETLSGHGERVHYGVSAHQGWRRNMEDAHIARSVTDTGIHLFAVFDGHGGPEVAKFCSLHMSRELTSLSSFQKGHYEEALVECFHRLDDLMLTPEGYKELERIRVGDAETNDSNNEDKGNSTFETLKKLVQEQRRAESVANGNGNQLQEMVQAGCTAVTALITPDNRIFVANAGDSRAVICRDGVALALSHDHKPGHATERARIIAAGGCLSEIGGITRVNGNLNLSRAIGDLRYKMNASLEKKDQIITAEPDVESTELLQEDSFLVLACDGIWDVMENQEVVDFIKQRLDGGDHPTLIASQLLDVCMSTDPRESRGIGCDNMTAAIIVFKPKSS